MDHSEFKFLRSKLKHITLSNLKVLEEDCKLTMQENMEEMNMCQAWDEIVIDHIREGMKEGYRDARSGVKGGPEKDMKYLRTEGGSSDQSLSIQFTIMCDVNRYPIDSYFRNMKKINMPRLTEIICKSIKAEGYEIGWEAARTDIYEESLEKGFEVWDSMRQTYESMMAEGKSADEILEKLFS